jgi:uncharacterized delta-60 repeat protein
LAVQADGKILVGGRFTALGGQSRSYLGRLNPDGTIDPAFNPGADNQIHCLALQADGKILVGGDFTSLAGQARSRIGRLNPNGSLDTTFNPGASDRVSHLALQADGGIVAGGNFITLGGQIRYFLGRLNADGTLDGAFNPNPNGNPWALALDADGKVLVGGNFGLLGGLSRNHIGRLNNTTPAAQDLSFDNSSITWLRGGGSPEVWMTSFETSTDGTNWTSLGAGARIANGWKLTDVSVPAGATVRARGFVSGGGFTGGASWFTESVVSHSSPLTILLDDGDFGFCSNRFGFTLRAAPGQAVVIEASTNFVSWAPLQTNLTASLGQIIFSDASSALFPHRFYRARLHPGALPPPVIRGGDGSMAFRAGRFGFNLTGVAGQTVVVDVSTNLVSWTGVATNTLGSDPLYFSDAGSTNCPQRFYRARLQ